MWQLILLLSLTLSSIAVLLQKLVHNNPESNPVKFAIVFQFVTGTLILLYGLVTNQLVYGNIGDVWFNLLIMTILYSLGNTLYFQGLKLTEASVYTLICSSSAIYAIVGSGIFFRQFLNLRQIVGLIILMSSIVVVNRVKGKVTFSKGVIYTMLGAMAMGFAIVNDKYVLGGFSVYAYLSLAFILPSILLALVYRYSLRDYGHFLEPKVFTRFIAFCLSFALQTVTYFTALKMTTNSSQFAGMAMFGNVLTVAMSMIFLKETDRMMSKLAALCLGIVGLALISS